MGVTVLHPGLWTFSKTVDGPDGPSTSTSPTLQLTERRHTEPPGRNLEVL